MTERDKTPAPQIQLISKLVGRKATQIPEGLRAEILYIATITKQPVRITAA